MADSSSAWTDLPGGIRVRQSRVYWMNSVVLSHAERTVIVDPGVLPSELDDLAAATRDTAETTLVFTHGDWDHVLGRPWWPGAATVAHDRFAAEVRTRGADIVAAAERAALEAGERWTRGFEPFRPTEAISGLRFTRVGPWRIVYRDAFGHSGSMLSLHLPDARLLVAADMLSDIEIPTLQQPPERYRETLEILRPLAEHGAIETLVPGHGAIARGRGQVLERLDRDLRYLADLERQVRAAVAAGLGPDQVEARLAEMDYLGKHAEYSMIESHRNNVRIAYEGNAAARNQRHGR